MFQRFISRCVLTALFITLACALATSGGCASSKPKPVAAAPPPAPPPPATLSQIKDDLVRARAQIAATNDAMSALTKSSTADVQANYDRFNVEFTKLQNQAEALRERSDDLKTRTQAYYDTWNKQAEVQNADLRRSATEQRAEAEKTFSTIRSEIELAKLSYEPYVSQLKDISSYLKENKTPAALATVSDIAARATADGKSVDKHLDGVLGGINKIMVATGAEAAAPGAAPAPNAAPAGASTPPAK